MKLLGYECKKLYKNSFVCKTVLLLLLICFSLAFADGTGITDYATDSQSIYDGYQSAVEGYIQKAETNILQLQNLGQPYTAYSYQYQLHIIELYENARDNIVIDGGYSAFWNGVYGFELLPYLIFAACVIIGSASFYEEKRTGAAAVIILCKKGRLATSAAKLCALVISSVFLTLIFSAAALLGIALGYGGIDGARAIQCTDIFSVSPYLLDTVEYFFISLGLKALCAVCVCLFTAVFSSLLENYIFIYICDVRGMGAEYRAKLGFMPQYPGMYPNFTADEFIHYIAVLKDAQRVYPKGKGKSGVDEEIDQLFEAVELTDVHGKRISSYSGGMKQRLALACAMVGNPEILLLDEPTAGLDPKQRIEVRNLLSRTSLGQSVETVKSRIKRGKAILIKNLKERTKHDQ